jgi:hypothetical protein
MLDKAMGTIGTHSELEPSLPVYGLCARQVRAKSNLEWANRVARAERPSPYKQTADPT